MELLVAVFVFIDYILYFAPPMWIEDRAKYIIVGMVLLLKTACLGAIVSH